MNLKKFLPMGLTASLFSFVFVPLAFSADPAEPPPPPDPMPAINSAIEAAKTAKEHKTATTSKDYSTALDNALRARGIAETAYSDTRLDDSIKLQLKSKIDELIKLCEELNKKIDTAKKAEADTKHKATVTKIDTNCTADADWGGTLEPDECCEWSTSDKGPEDVGRIAQKAGVTVDSIPTVGGERDAP